MKSTEIRQTFVDYFKKQNHTAVESSSLIPDNDPTLLFTNAGMNQFKNTFLGLDSRPYQRAVSVQKCVRAGGKHNDLDNVGFTARHHTFFEMLGNFSFGDYFKKDAIHFAWELLTKVYKIPKEKLYVTVYKDDDEAENIWHKQEGIPKDRIFRLNEDNFWRMGDTGPCGPCTEIFFDHGPTAGKESDPYKGIVSGEDRFIEIWNLVFMQFYEKSPGVMEPLPKPSVDTGSGLERLVAALQGNFNNYNTDLFTSLTEVAARRAGVKYITDPKILAQDTKARETTAALRVIADHARSAGFLIADGALPSNEGRGYVLRRIIRRAIRFGHKLKENETFLPHVVNALIESMGRIYPELENRSSLILSTLQDEEQRFRATLEQGSALFIEEIKKLRTQNKPVLSGDVAFKLYDTFGFPLDLTELMAQENGIKVDTAGFQHHMDEARTKAKASWKGQVISLDEAHLVKWSQEIKNKNLNFVGYDTLSASTKIVALSDGHKTVNELKTEQDGFVILEKTPFYAEGGGQVSDLGKLSTGNTLIAHVHDGLRKNDVFIQRVSVASGSLKVGDTVQATVTESLRRQTTANHSATHLMHAALRKTLGSHVTQAGSLVDPEKLRFDFSHSKPLTANEIETIENLVNEQISLGWDVKSQVMPYKEALQTGALALFGEKYADQVRVLQMGDFSCELCGGTHVKNTAQIRFFKIVSEGGVSAGVRRIEAVTGDKALQWAQHALKSLDQSRAAAGLSSSWADFSDKGLHPLPTWIEDRKSEIKRLEKEIRKSQSQQISIDELLKKAHTVGTGQIVFADLPFEDRDVLAEIVDKIKNKLSSGIVVALGQGSDQSPVIVSLTNNFTQQYKAGNLLKSLTQIMGGKGGGRPDFAQGAITDRSRWNEAQAELMKTLKS